MRLKFLAIVFAILLVSSILILGIPLVPAEPEELNKEISIHPNSTRELTIEVKKGTDIDFSWDIAKETQTIDFQIIGKEEKLPDIQGVKSAGKVEKVEGEKYTFVWENLDTKEKVTLNYIIIYEPKPEEETGCYTTAILMSILIMFIIFSAFGYFSKKH